MDIKLLTKNYLKSHVDSFKNIIHEFDNEYWEDEHFLIDLPRKWESSLYAENEDELTGFIISSNKGDMFHIHKFFVARNYRSCGIGAQLLNGFENIVKGTFMCNKVSLKVDQKNFKALRFYLKSGFVKKEEISDMFVLEKVLA